MKSSSKLGPCAASLEPVADKGGSVVSARFGDRGFGV